MYTVRYALLAMIITLPTFNLAQAQEFESNERQTGLLELYTSEGCSSCPPADKWLSTLKDEDGLWDEFIPLAFHVDYWDYIGWKDRFAHSSYTARQRLHAREQSMRTIYTPGFMYNGKEWRQWFVRRYLDFPEAGEVGKLLVNTDKGSASVVFSPITPISGDVEVNVAILGFELETEVKAGENEGDLLKHDFVVLGTRREILVKNNNRHVGSIGLPGVSQTAPRYALAIWVNPVDSQRPLQATGGWLN